MITNIEYAIWITQKSDLQIINRNQQIIHYLFLLKSAWFKTGFIIWFILFLRVINNIFQF